MSTIREPAVAGMFYPASETKLKNELTLLLDISRTDQMFDNISAVVVPHAGIIYSGKTAGFAYNLLKGKDFNRVVIISPSHREYFPGCSVYNGDAYRTPLGSVFVDTELRENLLQNSRNIFAGTEGHRSEHALEVQIPFLQMVFDEFTILPIVMGDQSKKYVDELAEKLASIKDENTLIVASSDLSHFYSSTRAEMLDSKVEKRIADFDFEGLIDDLASRKSEACGGGCVAAAMKASYLSGAKKSKVLYRNTSAETSGDNREVVGYLSAVIYK
jgi:AmmeMemoRadiSam system protein B